MAILTMPAAPTAHWYTKDGEPKHTMPRSKGDGVRNTTLRDARNMDLLPSVTSYLSVLNKPQLNTWKTNQAIEAAVNSPKQGDESLEYYCKRIISASMEQVTDAADLGTDIHDALEKATRGDPYRDDLRPYVEPVIKLKQEMGWVYRDREIILVSKKYGYAGTADVLFEIPGGPRGILDYKTRKTKPGQKLTPYDGQAMQLAAYAAAYYGEETIETVLAGNVYISTTEPGRVEVYWHDSLEAHWEAFKNCLHLWQYMKGYWPGEG